MSVLDLAHAHLQACIEAQAPKKTRGFGTGMHKKVISESMAFNKSQIPEVIEACKKHGVSVPDFASHGRPVFTSSRHMREFAKKIRGWVHYSY